jgi:hypothetical protein
MKGTTKVLALGQEEWIYTVRQALPHWHRNRFASAHSFWDLIETSMEARRRGRKHARLALGGAWGQEKQAEQPTICSA